MGLPFCSPADIFASRSHDPRTTSPATLMMHERCALTSLSAKCTMASHPAAWHLTWWLSPCSVSQHRTKISLGPSAGACLVVRLRDALVTSVTALQSTCIGKVRLRAKNRQEAAWPSRAVAPLASPMCLGLPGLRRRYVARASESTAARYLAII